MLNGNYHLSDENFADLSGIVRKIACLIMTESATLWQSFQAFQESRKVCATFTA